MSISARRAGQPLVVMAGILFAWTGMRIALWDADFGLDVEARPALPPLLAEAQMQAPVVRATLPEPVRANGGDSVATEPATRAQFDPPPRVLEPLPKRPVAPTASDQTGVAERHRTAASHSLLWLAAMAHVPIPAEIAERIDRDASHKDRSKRSSRFSADAWLFLRQGRGDPLSVGPQAASYGRSQAGGVVRYRLRPSSKHAPAAFLRATRSLSGEKQQELALGLSTRPLSQVPVKVHIEGRVTDGEGATELRPAAFVTGGLYRDDLPFGISVRGYAQAGYVGGDFATPFADGSLIAEREVARFDLGTVKAGAGAWGGAQEGASRLDVGPTTGVELSVGDVPVRLSVDYRVRVAGDASPGSGGALTLSTGF